MLKKLVLAATVAASLTAGAPAAHAAPVRFACGFDTLAQESTTGGRDTFTGVAYGYAVFNDLSPHTVRCYVTVDAFAVDSTPPGSGLAFVHTEGRVTYAASEGSNVTLCTEVDGVTRSCTEATETETPPQEVVDVVDALCGNLTTPPPPSTCPPYSWPVQVMETGV